MRSAQLKPAAFQILMALTAGESHGYGVMQRVREESGGAVSLNTGSFYRHLSKLIDEKLVEAVSRPAGDDPRRGDYYKLTAGGRQLLLEEKERLSAIVSALDRLKPDQRRGRT